MNVEFLNIDFSPCESHDRFSTCIITATAVTCCRSFVMSTAEAFAPHMRIRPNLFGTGRKDSESLVSGATKFGVDKQWALMGLEIVGGLLCRYFLQFAKTDKEVLAVW